MSEQQSFAPNKFYAVRWSRPVTMGVFKYLPANKTLIKGSALSRIVKEHGADVVASADQR